jgi:hypothetical protein
MPLLLRSDRSAAIKAAVCRFEESIEGSSYHVLSKLGKDKLWELLEQSVEEGER